MTFSISNLQIIYWTWFQVGGLLCSQSHTFHKSFSVYSLVSITSFLPCSVPLTSWFLCLCFNCPSWHYGWVFWSFCTHDTGLVWWVIFDCFPVLNNEGLTKSVGHVMLFSQYHTCSCRWSCCRWSCERLFFTLLFSSLFLFFLVSSFHSLF